MKKQTLSLEAAHDAIEAAIARAAELDARVCVAVVDDGGCLKAIARMDGATFMTPGIATNKAATAAGTGMSTQTLAAAIADDPAVLAAMANQEHVAIFPGGLPIVQDGEITGALGVSGGMAGEDQPIAEAGVAAVSEPEARR